MRLPLVLPSVFIISGAQGQIVRDFSDTAIAAADVESDTFNVLFDNSFENSGIEYSGEDDDYSSIGRSGGMDALRRRKKKKKKKKNKQRQKKRQNRPKPVQKPTPPTSLFKGVDELISNIAGDYNYSAGGNEKNR